MYRKNKIENTTIKINNGYKGESIEKKVRRIEKQNESIEDGAERIFTDRKDGVRPEYDIRTDRFELGIEATDFMTKSKITQREQRMAARLEELNGKADSVQGSGDSKTE